jgi:ABC-type branched-subunit amino acid transport system substrate-binding protein
MNSGFPRSLLSGIHSHKEHVMSMQKINLNEWFQLAIRALGVVVAATAFVFSARAENGVTGKDIVLGQSTALSGPLAELGKDLSVGAKTYFEYINQQGGVNGRMIRLITLDDGYDTARAVENVKNLIEKEKVFLLFNLFGTPANTALLPTISQVGIPSIAPYTGSQAVRAPLNPFIFNVRASYADETEKIVEHLRIRGIDKIAVVYQNNAFGIDGLASVEAALSRRKLKLRTSVSIENDASNVNATVKAVVDAKPQAVVMITAGKPSVEFIKLYNIEYIKAYNMQGSSGQLFFTLSVMGTQTSVAALGKGGVGVVVSQVAPSPFLVTTEIVNEYQRVMIKMGVKNWSFTSMEGFLNAKITVEGLKRAGRDLTRERFINAMESMGAVDFGGYRVNFSKTNHLGSSYVDLSIISKEGRFMQ